MKRDLLVEIGTEELPPKSLTGLHQALAREMAAGLDSALVEYGPIKSFATPRRLAILVEALADQQPDQVQEQLGPTVQSAFGSDGKPTAAAEGFARRFGVSVEQLERRHTEKGERLAFVQHIAGHPSSSLLPGLIEAALKALPVARWMRWGASRAEFVRPVHWALALFGDTPLDFEIFGVRTGRQTRGHRFLSGQVIDVPDTSRYLALLRQPGHVIADPDERRELIRTQVKQVAESLGGQAVIDEALLDEVAALVEYPVAMAGSFDSEFLQVPQEALISSMQGHQKYFPLVDAQGQLLPSFIFIANIDSSEPEAVIAGNQRVIRPRLADARFFYRQDLRRPLEDFRADLKHILFQRQLGSLFDRTERIAALAERIASEIGADTDQARRAGQLSKCDLATSMVLEFDELQGVMGGYYARTSGEPEAVACALGEQYLPRHATDGLPQTDIGLCLALADRLDTLTGIFGIGQSPTGSKDPFALRRASLAVLRVIVERRLRVPLKSILEQAGIAHTGLTLSVAETVRQVFGYLLDRLPAWFQDQGISVEPVRAVLKLAGDDFTDIHARVKAVAAFSAMPEATALASANKRVSNLLAKAGYDPGVLDPSLLVEQAEQNLFRAVVAVENQVLPLLEQGNYAKALKSMAVLRKPVDQLFDQVMILTEDASIQRNRLALLQRLRGLFLRVADISELPSDN